MPDPAREQRLRLFAADALALPADDVDLSPVVKNRCWRAEAVAGGSILVKAFGEETPFQTEVAMYDLLARTDAPVARLVARSESDRLLALEWAGDGTLEDAYAEASADLARSWALEAAAGLVRLDGALASLQSEMAQIARSGRLRDVDPLRRRFTETFARNATKILLVDCDLVARFYERPLSAQARRRLDTLLAAMIRALAASPVDLGTMDAHPSNVVLAGERLTFVDFDTVGWDWPLNRLFWFANGSDAAPGKVAHPLDRDVVAHYVRLRTGAGLDTPNEEDACDLADWIAIRHHISQASFWACRVTDPWPDLADLGEPRERLAALVTGLHRPLSRSRTSTDLREALAEYVVPSSS